MGKIDWESLCSSLHGSLPKPCSTGLLKSKARGIRKHSQHFRWSPLTFSNFQRWNKGSSASPEPPSFPDPYDQSHTPHSYVPYTLHHPWRETDCPQGKLTVELPISQDQRKYALEWKWQTVQGQSGYPCLSLELILTNANKDGRILKTTVSLLQGFRP